MEEGIIMHGLHELALDIFSTVVLTLTAITSIVGVGWLVIKLKDFIMGEIELWRSVK